MRVVVFYGLLVDLVTKLLLSLNDLSHVFELEHCKVVILLVSYLALELPDFELKEPHVFFFLRLLLVIILPVNI
jgi:hypothetical protein